MSERIPNPESCQRGWSALVKGPGGTESVRAFPTPVPGIIINEALPEDRDPEWLYVTHARSGLALFAHKSAEALAGAVLDVAAVADWTEPAVALQHAADEVFAVAAKWGCYTWYSGPRSFEDVG